jgi:hypothetical protein
MMGDRRPKAKGLRGYGHNNCSAAKKCKKEAIQKGKRF